jgi:hypothetical protein
MMKGANFTVALVFIVSFVLTIPVHAATANAKPLMTVKVSKESFSPALGDRVGIDVLLTAPGTLSAVVVDRDSFEVRTLEKNASSAECVVAF